ncbi:MAG TPA: TolC family protein [Chitinophagaceae bacterium]|nr:TolC family protein [Chitinophagaceae bacterium]
MRSVKYIFFIVLILSGPFILAQNDNRMSLQEAVDIAVKNNISLKQAELRVETADINRKQAKANMLPNINGDFNYGWNNGRNIDPFLNVYVNQQLTGSNIGVNGQWLLFNGLQVQNLIKQTRLTKQATEMDLQQNKETLTLNVILNYLQVLNNEDMLLNLENQAAVTKTQIDRLEVLVREGAIGQYQLSDLKGQYANDKVAIVNAKNSLDISKITLCQLLNIPYDAGLQLERNDAPMPTEIYAAQPGEIYKKASGELAIVKAGDLRVESAKRAVQVERSAFYPRVGLYGNLFSNYSSTTTRNIPGAVTDVVTDNYVLVNNVKSPLYTPRQQYSSEDIQYFDQMKNNIGSSFGIAAAIPIFNNFRTKYRVEQAKVLERNSVLEKQQIELNLKQQIDQGYAQMQASYNRFQAFQDQYNEYLESFRANEIRFNSGVINSFEYLSSKNNLDRARLSLTQVRYEYIFRTKILDYYQGMLSY